MLLSFWCAVAAFGTYFCMYAFRKPFTAASFDDLSFLGVGFKAVLVASQVIGYTLSKFLGVKVVSEMPPARRAVAVLVLIGISWAALLLFAVVPPPFNLFALFLNGLPLGMVFGLVLGFLEGRRHTEALAAGLCCSFILAGGVTKSAGAYLLDWGLSEWWMPAAAGLVFVPPLLFFVWMLSVIPPPTPEDVAARTERKTMDAPQRRAFFARHAWGLVPLLGAFLLVTILRSIRDDFAPEIWAGLGVSKAPAVFAQSEAWVALAVALAAGLTAFLSDNRLAFFLGMALSMLGLALLAGALLSRSVLGPMGFMVATGLGLYLPYVAVHTTLFERLIAMTRDTGTIGYLMSLADAFGYLGYVGVMLCKASMPGSSDMLPFFVASGWAVAVGASLLFAWSWATFSRRVER